MKQIVLLLGLMAGLVIASFTFASAYSVNKIGGEGSTTISGVTVSEIHYHLASDKSKIFSIEFQLDKPATTVQVTVYSGDSAWYVCRNRSGSQWECDLPGIEIAQVDKVRIIATGQ